jgi:two-component sensor histidine kinase
MSTSPIDAPISPASLAGLASSFDHAPWAVTELAGETHLVRYANPAFCQLIGMAHDEVIGRPFDGLAPATGECLSLLDRVYATGAAASFTAEGQAEPYPLFFSYTLWPVMAEGRTAGVMIQVNETGPLHETRQAISQALLLGAIRQHEMVEAADWANLQLQTEIGERKRREDHARMMTKEVAHRIKNNLQVIVALMANEIKRTPPPWDQGYRAMQNRVLAIAQLYDLISQSSRGHTVALDFYLTQIAKSLSASLLGDRSGIQIVVEAQAVEIESERAVPFGLLVNELTTNAVKHAFPDGFGLVTLSLRRLGDEVELRISDNGIGRTAPHQESAPGKHGTDYVAIFVHQLQGALVESGAPGGGTSLSIRFTLSPVAPASSSH